MKNFTLKLIWLNYYFALQLPSKLIQYIAQSAWAVEYPDCTSADG